jgi:anthranilate synthase/aminodeoxychorismate synthase-like glutamine amidotransferase
VLVVDNYDSFTWNLVHLVHEALDGEAEVLVRRSRETSVAELEQLAPDRVILSPGPGDPSAPGGGGAGVSVEAVRALSGRVPLLGVCLGHQAIGVAFGARVVRAAEVVHGKAREVFTEEDPLFVGLARPLVAMRYHSLVVESATLPPALRPIARAADGTLMAMRHASHPTVGLQFHPESIGTPEGVALVRSFLLLP